MFNVPYFISSAIVQGTPLLFGSTGEILTEKSGNLNLGIPGIMYIGAISGVIGGYFYQEGGSISPVGAVLIPLICCLIGSGLASLLYCFLTVTLRATQNVTGLALTTFGVGFGNFFGGSLIKLTKTAADGEMLMGTASLSLRRLAKYYNTSLPFAEKLGWFGEIFLSHGFMVYLAIVLAIVVAIVLKKTRIGLQLRAVGENAATADAAGINVTLYKYVSTCIGGAIAGLGGLEFVMAYSNGGWDNGSFGDRGWLAIALVIFAMWKPIVGMFGSYLFGGLYILDANLTIGTTWTPLFQMLPYVVTILVLIITSMRRKRENQPPASLGLAYFREER